MHQQFSNMEAIGTLNTLNTMAHCVSARLTQLIGN